MTQDKRADQAVRDGLELVSIVRDFGSDTIEEFLTRRSRHDLEALVVVLAAMVPDDRSVDQLLQWVRPPAPPAKTPRALKPHGTHAAFNRHRTLHEEPCAACWTAERLFQRDRKRQRRTNGVAA